MCDRVEGLLWEHRIPLDLETELKESWKGVRERKDTNSTYEAGDVRELGNGSSNDERQCPVSRDHDNPEDLAHLEGKRGSTKELLEDVVIDDFDADVTVQSSCNETRDNVADIGGGLVVIWRESLHNWVK